MKNYVKANQVNMRDDEEMKDNVYGFEDHDAVYLHTSLLSIQLDCSFRRRAKANRCADLRAPQRGAVRQRQVPETSVARI